MSGGSSSGRQNQRRPVPPGLSQQQYPTMYNVPAGAALPHMYAPQERSAMMPPQAWMGYAGGPPLGLPPADPSKKKKKKKRRTGAEFQYPLTSGGGGHPAIHPGGGYLGPPPPPQQFQQPPAMIGGAASLLPSLSSLFDPMRAFPSGPLPSLQHAPGSGFRAW